MPYEKLVVSDWRLRQTWRLHAALIQCLTRNPLEQEQCLANSPLELEYCPSQLTSGHGPVFGQRTSTLTTVQTNSSADQYVSEVTHLWFWAL